MNVKNAKLCALVLFLGFCQSLWGSAVHAAFTLSIDPTTLTFNGPGNHTINVLLTHDGTGLSTFSGMTLRFGGVADASLGVLPDGVVVNSATEGAVFLGESFDFDPATNTVAMASLVAANSDVGASQTVSLFTMELNLANKWSYDIGVDFQNAQRGNILTVIEDISGEFFATNQNTDFQFTLTNAVAVPEPGSMLVLAAMGIGGVCYRKRKPSVV